MWLLLYRNKIEQELGVAMPDGHASRGCRAEFLVAKEAAQSLLGKNQAEVQQQQAAAQQADPLTQNSAGGTQDKTRRASAQNYYGHGEAELDKLSKWQMEVQRERVVKKSGGKDCVSEKKKPQRSGLRARRLVRS